MAKTKLQPKKDITPVKKGSASGRVPVRQGRWSSMCGAKDTPAFPCIRVGPRQLQAAIDLLKGEEEDDENDRAYNRLYIVGDELDSETAVAQAIHKFLPFSISCVSVGAATPTVASRVGDTGAYTSAGVACFAQLDRALVDDRNYDCNRLGFASTFDLEKTRAVLKSYGDYLLVETPKDGNCMFNAVRRSLACDDTYSSQHLRRQVVWFMANNAMNFALRSRDQIRMLYGTEAGKAHGGPHSIRTYMEHMARPTQWGEDIVLAMISYMWSCKITVLTVPPEPEQQMMEVHFRHKGPLTEADILLVHTGKSTEHYLGVVQFERDGDDHYPLLCDCDPCKPHKDREDDDTDWEYADWEGEDAGVVSALRPAETEEGKRRAAVRASIRASMRRPAAAAGRRPRSPSPGPSRRSPRRSRSRSPPASKRPRRGLPRSHSPEFHSDDVESTHGSVGSGLGDVGSGVVLDEEQKSAFLALAKEQRRASELFSLKMEAIIKGKDPSKVAAVGTAVLPLASDAPVREADAKVQCVICKRWMKDRSNLQKHLLSQHGSSEDTTRFECDQCSKSCSTAGGLKRHVDQVHTAPKKPAEQLRSRGVFPCDKCDVSCGSASALKKHQQQYHEDQGSDADRTCAGCGKTIATKQQFQEHLKNCPKSDQFRGPFKCYVEGCTYQSNRMNTLNVHLKNRHGITKK